MNKLSVRSNLIIFTVANQTVSSLLWNLRFHHCITKYLATGPTLTQLTPSNRTFSPYVVCLATGPWPFPKQVSKECDIALSVPSSGNFSSLEGHPVAAYVIFVVAPLVSILQ